MRGWRIPRQLPDRGARAWAFRSCCRTCRRFRYRSWGRTTWPAPGRARDCRTRSRTCRCWWRRSCRSMCRLQARRREPGRVRTPEPAAGRPAAVPGRRRTAGWHIDGLLAKYESGKYFVRYATELTELAGGQKLVRLYDPSGNLIEVRTPFRCN